MRISDWSSDVCSSDLSSFLVQAINHCLTHPLTRLSGTLRIKTMMGCLIRGPQIPISISSKMVGIPCRCIATSETVQPMGVIITFISKERSEERHVGKECVHTCRSRGSSYH